MTTLRVGASGHLNVWMMFMTMLQTGIRFNNIVQQFVVAYKYFSNSYLLLQFFLLVQARYIIGNMIEGESGLRR